MLISDCSKCCFLKNEKCIANQYIIKKDNYIYTPGFCRLYRDNDKLTINQVKKDSNLKFDFVIIFDSEKNSFKSLIETITTTFCNSLVQRIIVISIGKNQNKELLNYWKSNSNNKNLFIKIMIEETNIEKIIRQSTELFTSKYFFVLPCGKFILSPENLIDIINEHKDRFVFWPCYCTVENTKIAPKHPIFGLYITQVYKKLTRIFDKSFIEIINKSENELGISLMSFVEGNQIV